jgi:hypothetical protein
MLFSCDSRFQRPLRVYYFALAAVGLAMVVTTGALAAASRWCSLRCALSHGVVVARGPWSSGSTSLAACGALAASFSAACRRAMTSLLALSCAIICPASRPAQDGADRTSRDPSTPQRAKLDADDFDFIFEAISNTSFNARPCRGESNRPRLSVEMSRPLTRRPIRIWRG